MGFFEDLLRGATAPGVMQNGMNVGIGGMAEAQRQRELQNQLQQQQQQQAFLNMFRQKEFDYNAGRDQVADQRYNQEYQDNKFLQQTGDAQKLGFDMLSMQNQLADNVRQDKLVNAQVGNLGERRAPSQEEFLWQQMTPEQQQAFITSYTQNKFKPAANGGGQGAQITPSGLISLNGQMNNPLMNGGRTNVPFEEVTAMAGKIQNTADSLNAVNGGQPPMMPQVQQGGGLSPEDQEALDGLQSMDINEIDWQATMAKYPNLNWQAIMQAMGAK